MSFYTGSVLIDNFFYTGNDAYSDGPIEDEFLDMAKAGDFESILKNDNRWPVLYHFSDIRENLLEWYPFSEDASLLEIGSGCGALTGVFCRKVNHVTAVELSMKRSLVNANRNREFSNLEIIVGNFEKIEPSLKLYDYITLIGVWEYAASYITDSSPYKKLLQLAKSHLKPSGKLFIAIENKMGIKYWNGAAEDHTGLQFSGLENYVGCDYVRTFSKPEIEQILCGLGFNEYSFYYPMPDYKLPETIYTDEILPQPGAERNYRKDYSAPRQYLFNDAIVMDQISADKMFPYFANSFLIVVGDSNPKISFCKYNRQRKKEFRTKIEMRRDDTGKLVVIKAPLTRESEKHVMALKKNEHFCKEAGLEDVSCPQGEIKDNCYIIEYIEGQDLNVEIYRNLDVNSLRKKFQEVRQKFIECAFGGVFQPTDEYVEWFGESFPLNVQPSMQCTNIDMSMKNIRRNMFGELFCIDYEWVFNFPIPIDYVLWRMVIDLYCSYGTYLNKKINIKDFCMCIGISAENLGVFEKMEKQLASKIFGNGYSEMYLKRYVQPCITQQWSMHK